MPRTVLLPLALAFALPALAGEPAHSPSFYIERDDTDQPAVARGGDVQLVVWTDRRNAATTGADIYGARIRVSDGAILDPGGFPICVEPGDQVGPRLAGNEGTFLVAWTDKRAGNDDVYAARVRDGSVLDAGGFVVSASSLLAADGSVLEGAAEELRPFVASGAGMWLVAWEDWRRSSAFRGEVFVARVDTEASVLDLDGIRVSTGDGGERDRIGGLVSNGKTFAAIHTSGTFSHVSLIAPDAKVQPEIAVGGSTSPLSTGATALATDGGRFLALWNEYDHASGDIPGLRARVLSADGTPADESFRVGDAYDDPSVAWTGSDYLVVNGGPTETGHALFGARLTAEGRAGEGPMMLLARDAGYSAAAGADGTVLVVATREDDVLAVGVHFDGASWTVEPSDDADPTNGGNGSPYDGGVVDPVTPRAPSDARVAGVSCSVATGPRPGAGALLSLAPLGLGLALLGRRRLLLNP